MVRLCFLFCFPTILCVEYAFRMQQHLNKLPPNTPETKRLRSMDKLFIEYIETHGVDAVSSWSSEQLCSAKFVGSSPNLGCERAGNLIDAFFDDIAFALLLNRTLVVHWTGHRCDGALELQPWVLTYTTLVSLRQQQHCPTPIVKSHFDTNFMGNSWCCYDDVMLPNSTYFIGGDHKPLSLQHPPITTYHIPHIHPLITSSLTHTSSHDTPSHDTPSHDTPSPDTPSHDTPSHDTPSPDTSILHRRFLVLIIYSLLTNTHMLLHWFLACRFLVSEGLRVCLPPYQQQHVKRRSDYCQSKYPIQQS